MPRCRRPNLSDSSFVGSPENVSREGDEGGEGNGRLAASNLRCLRLFAEHFR